MAVSLRKIDFPAVIAAAYRGNVSNFRTELLDHAAWLDRSPGAKPDWINQIDAFIAYIKGPAKVVQSGVKYTGPAITGTYATGYTFTIVNGVITAIAAS